MRPARPFPSNNGSTYRPRPRSASTPPPRTYTGNFPPRPISTIADNAARSGDSFAQTSRTLPPLMIGQDGRRSVPFRLPPPPPPRYPNTVSMHPDYDGETDIARDPWPGKQVRRIPPERLGFYGVQFGPDGLLRGRGGREFNSTSSNAFGNDPRAIFVMNADGRIFASNDVVPGEFHHSTLSGGGPVAAAGELSVRNGRVQFVTAASGHYRPQWAHMLNVKREFERQGILGVEIWDHQGPAGGNLMFVTGQN